jgi:undecaprenyl-diphosphatase
MNIALHVGTLFSIAVVYRAELKGMWKRPRLCLLIVLATIPAAAVGLTLKPLLEEAFASPLVVGCGWVVTAGLLLAGQRLQRDEQTLDTMRTSAAVLIGMFQAVALIPGISRSGSTIAGGLIAGLKRETAAAFSFLIAIPAIAGAAVVECAPAIRALCGSTPSATAVASAYEIGPLLVGGATSFVVGLFALRWLIGVVAQRRLHWFAYYCLALGVATVVWQLSPGV